MPHINSHAHFNTYNKSIIYIMFPKVLAIALVIVCLIVGSNCTLGVMLEGDFNTSVFQCIAKSGFKNATIIIQDVDLSSNLMNKGGSIQTLTNLKNAGLGSSFVLVLCRSVDASSMVRFITQSIPRYLYDRVWVYADYDDETDDQCRWNQPQFTPASNCQYLKKTLDEFKKVGVKVGVAAFMPYWDYLFKDQCKDIGHEDLFWAFGGNLQQNFNDFKPFGGWKKPTVKSYQFGPTICGTNGDLYYFE